MYFSRSVMAAALVGYAAATNHEMPAASESMLMSATSSALASLQTSTGASMGSSAPAASGGNVATHVVQVGGTNGSLIFSPNNVIAAPGDLVQFQFHPKNHSVVQSNFDNPCVPIQNITPNKTDAFFSGFMPVNASLGSSSSVLTYTIRVKDTKPMWYYCSQGKHCQAGMVGAVNAPTSGNKTMAAFIGLAAQAAENLSPGQAPGSGAAGNSPSGPSGTTPNSGGAGGNLPPSPSVSSPAQQSANSAPGLSSQSFFGLGAAAVAAFAML